MQNHSRVFGLQVTGWDCVDRIHLAQDMHKGRSVVDMTMS